MPVKTKKHRSREIILVVLFGFSTAVLTVAGSQGDGLSVNEKPKKLEKPRLRTVRAVR